MQKETNRKVKIVRVKKRRIAYGRIMITIIILLSILSILKFNLFNKKDKNIVFVRETSSLADLVLEEEQTDYVWGVDISHWQSDVIDNDFLKQAREKGCKFVYIQFGKTNCNIDDMDNPVLDYSNDAIRFANLCEENRIKFGFYFLTDATMESSRLGEFGGILKFLQKVEKNNYEFNSLPLMLDHEVYGVAETPEDLNSRREMLRRQLLDLRESGIDPIVYTSGSEYAPLKELFDNDNQIFWIADYSYVKSGIAPDSLPEKYVNEPNIAIWQYSGDELLIEERGIPVTLNSDSEQLIQQSLDRNLMRRSFFERFV